jgi:nucleotide-binding universal stress UspA family protein
MNSMAKRILAPIGAEDRSDAVVPVLAGLAHGAGSTVRLLRVFPIPEHVVGDHGRVIAYVDQETERLTAEGLRELRHVEAQLDGIPVETVVRFGDSAEEIALEAEAFDADLIALVTDRSGRVWRAIAPSVADRVVEKSAIPTLVLHE